MGDCGLTGRKIIVDTYGGMARHGGGAFSGKDPSKVDRSAAYAARYVAKNVVAAGLADRARGPGRLRDRRRAPGLGDGRDLRHREDRPLADPRADQRALRPAARAPSGEYLHLHRPIYQKTAAYGHFGREDHDFTWERTDKAGRAARGRRARRRAAIKRLDGTGYSLGPGGSLPAARAAPGRPCARSARGSATPAKTKSNSALPAVSKSTCRPQDPLVARDWRVVDVLDALQAGLVEPARESSRPSIVSRRLVIV